ncbi:HET-6OR heterokaryon incompatibility protein [Paramyrothecium foliicola]|nr:HET-6OR heterokaryon incompatibility protein [Paramyrothecium foliicola]
MNAFEFCYEGEGAICRVSTKLTDMCVDVDGEEFRECTCESGSVEAFRACQYCRAVTGQSYDIKFGSRGFDACKAGGFSVAPIPASYISEIKERNKTVTMPKVTSTWSVDRSFTTASAQAITGTVPVVVAETVTLPTLIPPTAPADSTGAAMGLRSRRTAEYLLGTALVACLVVIALGQDAHEAPVKMNAQRYVSLIRTHHITSRKKVQKLKKAASLHNLECVILRSGGSPGIMYAQGRDAAGVEGWVSAVQSLRYKDYQCVSKPALSQIRMVQEASNSFKELVSVTDFGEEMSKRGLQEWWRKAMGYSEGLHPGNPGASSVDAPLYSSICTVPIESTPPFKALSYCWGRGDSTHSIDIDGGLLGITESLHKALIQLRDHNAPVLMWVDQICINQRDMDEKSDQVRLMDRIYAKAEQVVIWLGPASSTSQRAIEFCRDIGQAALEIGFQNYMGPQNFAILEAILDERNPDDVEWQRISALFDKTKDALRSSIQALFDLDQREWFRRVWIVQEFCLAASPFFVCGNSTVEADIFKYARVLQGLCVDREFMMSLSSDQYSLFSRLNDPTPALFSARDHRQKFRSGQSPGDTLSQVLKKVYIQRDAEAKLRVDRIFGLLSLATDAESLGITVDYNRTAKEVLCSTALSIIKSGDLSILSYVQFPRATDADAADLPSWVPDWHSNLRPSFYPYPRPGESHLFASGDRAPIILNDSNHSLLGLVGFMVDTIEDVGSVWIPSSPGPSYNPTYTESCLSEVHLLCRISALKNMPIYDSSIRRNSAVWRIPIGDIYTANQAGGENRAGSAAERAYLDLLKSNASFEKVKIDPRNNDFDVAGKNASFYRLSMSKMTGKRPFITRSGYVGMAPSTTQSGDVVVNFLGLCTCSVLRDQGVKYGKQTFFHLGEAYCDGVMDGELEPKADRTSFYLI